VGSFSSSSVSKREEKKGTRPLREVQGGGALTEKKKGVSFFLSVEEKKEKAIIKEQIYFEQKTKKGT